MKPFPMSNVQERAENSDICLFSHRGEAGSIGHRALLMCLSGPSAALPGGTTEPTAAGWTRVHHARICKIYYQKKLQQISTHTHIYIKFICVCVYRYTYKYVKSLLGSISTKTDMAQLPFFQSSGHA